MFTASSLADHAHARDDDRVLRLRVVSSSEPALVGVTFAITQDSLRIGRGPDNEIVIDDSGLSRHHAILERTPSGWTLRDAGSANGLWVGDARVGSVVLTPEVHVRIGGTVLALADSNAAATIVLDAHGRPLQSADVRGPAITPSPSPTASTAAPRGPAIAPAPSTGKSSSVALVIVLVLVGVVVVGGVATVLFVPGLSARIAGLFGGSTNATATAPEPTKADVAKPTAPEKPKAPPIVAKGAEITAPPSLALADVREAREASIDGTTGGEIVLANGARLTIDAGAFIGAQTLALVRTGARGVARTHGFVGEVYVVTAADLALPTKRPRLEIPIDRAAFPTAKGDFAVYAMHGDGVPYRVTATHDAARDVMVIEHPVVHVIAPPAKRDLDEAPGGNSGSNSNANSGSGSSAGGNSGSNTNSTAFTTAPTDTAPKIACGKAGSILDPPKQVFRIHAGADTSCAHMTTVAEILHEAYGVYQREYKTAAGKPPFDGWMSPDSRMNVTISAMTAEFPEGEYNPWWGGGSMTLASATARPDALYGHELRVTLYHELFHTVQDMSTAMAMSKVAGRMWWTEATAEWAGRRYARRPTQPSAMQDMVANAYRPGHGTPWILRFPIDESRSWKGGRSAYHYAMLVEFIENKSPGYVRKALQGGDIRGETLLESMYAAGSIATTYPELALQVRDLAAGTMPLDGKIMETSKQTRIYRRAGTAHDDMLIETPTIETEYEKRFTAHSFSAKVAPATARLFYVKVQGDAKPDVSLGVGVSNGSEMVDHALLITSTGSKRIEGSWNNHISKVRSEGDVWLLVFRPYAGESLRTEQTYTVSLSLYLDCPRPGGVMIGGGGGARKSRQTIEHEACYARNGYREQKQADGTLKWVDIASP